MSRENFHARMRAFIANSPKQWVRMLRDHGPLRAGEQHEVTAATAGDWQRRNIVELIDPPESA